MKYLKRYNKFNFQTNCRICLTQSVAKMIALDAPLNGDLVPKPLVYEALELVMSEKVNFNEQYPQTLCAVCVELLKISYELKIQYHQSQKKLKEELGEGELDKDDGKHADLKKSEEDKALVEILVGSERFNIHDVFIVEEDDQDDEMFDGFLNNLGKTISASFVKKGYKKPKPVLEVPSLIIEKVGQDSKPTTEDDRNTPETRLQEFKNAYDSQDEEQQTVISDDEAVIDDNDADMIDDDATIVNDDAEIVNNEAEIIDNDAKIVDNEAETVDNDVAIVDNYAAIVDNEASDDIFIDTPVSDEIVKKFVTSTENDKKALESAMGLKYKCPYCEKPMSSLKKVKLHTSRTCTKNNSNARCYVCGVSFEFRRQLLTHLKQVHLVRIKKSQELKDADKHKCHVCDKVFRSNGSLFYHMSKHLGKRYDCDKCDKRFYTKSQAANHRQTHNREDTLVICPICGKGFHYQSGLFYHMKMHTNERNYQCSFCPRRFYTRNSLKRHELTHTGARPYACNYCDKKFRSLGEVKKHKLLHTGERPYQCKYCNLGFTQAHNLKVHLMTHPGSFQCMHCTKGFPEKEILRFHLHNKHGVRRDEQNEDDFYQGEETENIDQDDLEEQDGVGEQNEAIPQDEAIPQEYFITEEYIDDEGQSIVQTYEVRDEVLVETVEENLQ